MIEQVFDPGTDAPVAIAEPAPVPAALQSSIVLAVARDVELTAAAAGSGLEPSMRAKLIVSALLRRLAGISRGILEREQQQRLEIKAIEMHHAPYFQRARIAMATIEDAIKALRPMLPFPTDKNGKIKSKTMQFPHGSVGFSESGGGLRKKKDATDPKKDDALADALLDRWCVLNQAEGTVVQMLVPMTADALTALRKDMRAQLLEDPLAMLPADLVVMRPSASEIKKLVKDTGEVPDGMETAPDTVKEVITCDGLAASAVEAMDITLTLEDEAAGHE